MKSEDTKRIIREIAEEEGLTEYAVELIVKSQFEGVYDIVRSATPDNIDTFKSVRLNAFGHFKVRKDAFKKFKGREAYLKEKEKRYDSKR